MINYVDVSEENRNRDNLNCQRIPDHPYRILITGDHGWEALDPKKQTHHLM